nr:hypothetical protein GCM10020063_028070 [Dactylosporangium thailandense]
MPAPNGCFYAVGAVDDGSRRHVGVWLGTGACDQTQLINPTELPSAAPGITERNTVVDAVERNGTWMTLVASTAAGSAWGDVLRGTPGHWEQTRLREPPDDTDDTPTAVGVIGNEFVAVGQRGRQPAAYFSSGGSWNERDLPSGDLGTAEPLGIASAPTGPAVIVGRAGGVAIVWSSRDGGATWSTRRSPDLTELTEVVHDGELFLAIGAAADGTAQVLTSADGAIWNTDTAALPKGTGLLQTIQVLGPGQVYAVGRAGAGEQCATAWHRESAAWRPEPLGCHGTPTALLKLADGRFAAVGGTTLWLRKP